MAVERVVNINVNDNIDDVESKVNDLNKTLDDTAKNTDKVNDNLKDTAKGVEEVGKSTKKAEGGLKKIGSGIKGIGLAFKAAGIGLIIAGFAALKEVFSQNQKIADAMSTAFETISIVFNEVARVVGDVYDRVSEATGGFDALGKVLGGVVKLALAPFKAAFYGIKLAIEEVQLIWENSPFGSGDLTTINKLQDQIKQTKEDLVDVGKEVIKAGGDIVTNVVEAAQEIGQFTKEVISEVSDISVSAAKEQAKAMVEAKNNAQIAAAQQSLLIEQYDRQAEKLRQVRDEERNSIEERKKANDQLNEVLDKQEKALLKQADLQIKSAKFEFDKNQSIENRTALIEAQANREGVLAQIEGLRSEQLANDLALDREKLELVNAKLEAEQVLAIEEKRFLAERIEDEETRLQALIDVAEEERNLELERLEEKKNLYKEGTQSRLDAEIEFNARKQELDQQVILAQEELANRSVEINEEANKKQKESDEALKSQKIDAVQSTFSTIGNLAELFAGKSKKQQERAFKIQKAANVASAIIDTYKAANLALASAPPPLSFAFAGAAITAGLLNVKNIASQKFDSGSVPSGGGGSAPNISSPQNRPSFNIVGGGGANQLKELESTPIKAYVVSGDVSSAQSLDRNRQQNATF